MVSESDIHFCASVSGLLHRGGQTYGIIVVDMNALLDLLIRGNEPISGRLLLSGLTKDGKNRRDQVRPGAKY